MTAAITTFLLAALGFIVGRWRAAAAPLAAGAGYGIYKQIASPDEPEYWQVNLLVVAVAAAAVVAAGVAVRRAVMQRSGDSSSAS